jgi:hypothetical protein
MEGLITEKNDEMNEDEDIKEKSFLNQLSELDISNLDDLENYVKNRIYKYLEENDLDRTRKFRG